MTANNSVITGISFPCFVSYGENDKSLKKKMYIATKCRLNDEGDFEIYLNEKKDWYVHTYFVFHFIPCVN